MESEDARVDVQQRALNVVMLQLLAAQDEGDYQLYGVNARMFATDAAGTIALHNTCKQLASHDITAWYDNMRFCYWQNREEARLQDPEYERDQCLRRRRQREREDLRRYGGRAWSSACSPRAISHFFERRCG